MVRFIQLCITCCQDGAIVLSVFKSISEDTIHHAENWTRALIASVSVMHASYTPMEKGSMQHPDEGAPPMQTFWQKLENVARHWWHFANEIHFNERTLADL